jgi:hypothetical protein
LPSFVVVYFAERVPRCAVGFVEQVPMHFVDFVVISIFVVVGHLLHKPNSAPGHPLSKINNNKAGQTEHNYTGHRTSTNLIGTHGCNALKHLPIMRLM